MHSIFYLLAMLGLARSHPPVDRTAITHPHGMYTLVAVKPGDNTYNGLKVNDLRLFREFSEETWCPHPGPTPDTCPPK